MVMKKLRIAITIDKYTDTMPARGRGDLERNGLSIAIKKDKAYYGMSGDKGPVYVFILSLS